MRNTSHFFLLLRYAMKVADGYPEGINASEWHDLFIFSKEQSLLGVMYEGIDNMPPVSVLPRRGLLSWLAIAEKIKNRNKILNERCIELTKQLEKDGFQCCILKGQGNALMYPNPYSRTPGDIDLWCLPQPLAKEGKPKPMKKQINEVVKYNPATEYLVGTVIPMDWKPPIKDKRTMDDLGSENINDIDYVGSDDSNSVIDNVLGNNSPILNPNSQIRSFGL